MHPIPAGQLHMILTVNLPPVLQPEGPFPPLSPIVINPFRFPAYIGGKAQIIEILMTIPGILAFLPFFPKLFQNIQGISGIQQDILPG